MAECPVLLFWLVITVHQRPFDRTATRGLSSETHPPYPGHTPSGPLLSIPTSRSSPLCLQHLGGRSFTTGCKSPTEQGIIMWNAECTLRHAGHTVNKVLPSTGPPPLLPHTTPVPLFSPRCRLLSDANFPSSTPPPPPPPPRDRVSQGGPRERCVATPATLRHPDKGIPL